MAPPAQDVFDGHDKNATSQDDAVAGAGGGAAATAALNTLFNSEQGYNIDMTAFPTNSNPPPPNTSSAGDATGADGANVAVPDAAGAASNAQAAPATAPSTSSDPAASASPQSAAATGAGAANDTGNHSGSNDGGGVGPIRQKRPGTSRQHMLTRGGACEFCKRRKLKCTAEVPQCAACRRSNRECVYSQKKQRSRMKLLEDKVSELETRLAENRPGHGSATPPVAPGGAMTAGAAPPHPPPAPVVEHHDAPSAGIELAFLGLAEQSNLTLADMSLAPGTKHEEPDLMTLAHAAAGDTGASGERMPWEGMEPQAIADDIVRAVIGQERGGVGEKICAHLIQTFMNTAERKMARWILSPSYFVGRLSGRGGQQPHPSLVLALMPLIMPFSSSPTLSDYNTFNVVTDTVVGPSRALQQQALSSLDPRVLDLVAASMLRSFAVGAAGRFVDGWNENSTACSLLWATGLGKLGCVGERFVPPSKRPADRPARVERELLTRLVRMKGQIVPPPSDAMDAAERIKLFWSIWINDRINGIGWNWPGAIETDEVTTPLPQDNYDTPEALCDNTTLSDFLTEKVHSTSTDGLFATQIKTIALAYEASRLLDRAPSVASPDKGARLMRITRRHMAVMPKFSPSTPEEAIALGSVNQAWQICNMTLLLLYAKEEIDAPSPFEETEARDKMIEAGINVTRSVQAAYDAGDHELEGFDMLAPIIWFVVGRAFHHLAQRIESTDPLRAAELRERNSFLVEATGRFCKTTKLNDVYYQMLFNVSMDQEVMLGEYRRPDNFEFDIPS